MTTKYIPVADINGTLEQLDPGARVFIIVADPLDAKRLMEKTDAVKRINVGNMHMSEGSTRSPRRWRWMTRTRISSGR